ncbi:hypothetical protein ACHAPA_007677 [Fusarium lateritium]
MAQAAPASTFFSSIPEPVSSQKYSQDGSASGIPRNLVSPLAWGPSDLPAANSETTRLQLSAVELSEIQTALDTFKESGLEVHTLSPEVFPLPSLEARLHEFAKALHQGYGFFTIRGLKPNSFSSNDNIIIHVGIASYIGDMRALQQNYSNTQAEALLHVCDVKQYNDNIQEDVFLAPGNESVAVGFHSDNGDNVSLYCWSTAEEGGDLYLSSAWKVYNELALKSPDVLRMFAQPWQWQDSRTGEEKLRSHMAPIIYLVNNKLVINYQKRPLRGSKQETRDHRLDPLSQEQEAALAMFDRVAAENAICLEQEPGDMHFFNNLALLHSRSAFRDGTDQMVQRHLTRLIFRNSKLGWEIPTDLLPNWSKYYDHAREIEQFPEEPHPWAFSLSGHD